MTTELPSEIRLTITKFRKDEDGIYRARATINGNTLEFEERGGWHTTERIDGYYREALPFVARALSAKTPKRKKKSDDTERPKPTEGSSSSAGRESEDGGEDRA